MTKELFNKACKLDSEIGRINMLIKQVEKGDEDDILMNPKYNDFAYIVHLFGVRNVLGFLRRRKNTLEKEFEEL